MTFSTIYRTKYNIISTQWFQLLYHVTAPALWASYMMQLLSMGFGVPSAITVTLPLYCCACTGPVT